MLRAIIYMVGGWITGLIYGQDKAEEHNGMRFLWTMLLLGWFLALIGAVVENDDLAARIFCIVYLAAIPAVIYYLYRKNKSK